MTLIEWPKQKCSYSNAYEPLIYREYCKQVKLITDIAARYTDIPSTTKPHDYYQNLKYTLESFGHIVGHAISATAVYPGTKHDRYPQNTVSIERLPDGAKYQGQRGNGIWDIDITDEYTASCMKNEIKRLWRLNPAKVYFVDNCPAHSSAWGGAPHTWSQACNYIGSLRRYANTYLKARCVFNIALHVAALTDQEMDSLLQAIGTDAICFEMPLHLNIRNNPDALAAQTKRYIELLDHGVALLWIPLGDQTTELLYNYQKPFRKDSHHLFIDAGLITAPDPLLL